jgi:hypothetical protein
MEGSLSVEQKKIIEELQKIDTKALQSYKGALKTIRDSDNPDRFSQTAHSLREVTGIISRRIVVPQEKDGTLKKKIEKEFVEKSELLPSPVEKDTRVLIERWDYVHNFFVKIAHHGSDVDEKQFLSMLSEFESILLTFLRPVPEVFEELDSLLEIVTPSQNHVKKLCALLIC